ncbi:MAG: shikimate kinase [Gemmatimonadales bacterium]
MTPAPSRRHVVLVGLPGSGKTTVGREAGSILGARFSDIDQEIERETGLSVPELFASRGESEFRRLEALAMGRALAGEPGILAPGGGWAVQPGNLDSAGEGILLIYLAIAPAVAAGRLAGDTGRPLLAGGDLTRRLTALLAEREAWYRRAAIEIDASREVTVVAAAVVAAARRFGGWGDGERGTGNG